MKLSIPVSIIIAGLFIGGVIYFSLNDKKPITSQEKVSTVFVNNKDENRNNLLNVYKKVKSSLPAHGLVCIPETKSQCGVDGCTSVKPGVFVILGENNNNEVYIARCDSKPCDVYPANMTTSGAYISVDTKEPHGMLFKSSTIDQSFIEIVTLGTESLVSNGYCYQPSKI